MKGAEIMISEKSLKNITPLNQRSEEERREIARKGQKAGAEKRRKQKSYRELTAAILRKKVKNSELSDLAKQYGIENPDVKTITLIGMINAAANGSYNAFEKLLELTGEKIAVETAEEQKQAELLKAIEKAVTGGKEG